MSNIDASRSCGTMLCCVCQGPIGVQPRSYNRARSMKRLRWCNKFRGFIENVREHRYTLSGISYDQRSYFPFVVPYDRGDLYDYEAESNGVLTYIDDRRLLSIHWLFSRLRCHHLVHTACWDIVGALIGHQAEDRLDLLLLAMNKSQKRRSYGVQGLVGSEPCEGARWKGDRVLETTHQYRLIPVTDPIDIPLLRKLIARSQKDAIGEASGELMARPIASEATWGLGTLPVEIQAMILNLLPEWSDVQNSLEAFSCELPDFLWRQWFPRDLILDELDGIPNYKIDWKALNTGIMRLLKTELGMKNRARIIRAVKEIREDFLRLLEDDSSD